MKYCTLFALIGCILNLLIRIWWTVVDIVGYETFRDALNIARSVSDVILLVCAISLVVFFAMLFFRQK